MPDAEFDHVVTEKREAGFERGGPKRLGLGGGGGKGRLGHPLLGSPRRFQHTRKLQGAPVLLDELIDRVLVESLLEKQVGLQLLLNRELPSVLLPQHGVEGWQSSRFLQEPGLVGREAALADEDAQGALAQLDPSFSFQKTERSKSRQGLVPSAALDGVAPAMQDFFRRHLATLRAVIELSSPVQGPSQADKRKGRTADLPPAGARPLLVLPQRHERQYRDKEELSIDSRGQDKIGQQGWVKAVESASR